MNAGTISTCIGALLGGPPTSIVGQAVVSTDWVDGLVPLARSERICAHEPVPSSSPEKVLSTNLPLYWKYTFEKMGSLAKRRIASSASLIPLPQQKSIEKKSLNPLFRFTAAWNIWEAYAT